MSKQTKQSKTLVEHVEQIENSRFINGEYRRGFMEGQQSAAKAFAAVVDAILGQFNTLAIGDNWNAEPDSILVARTVDSITNALSRRKRKPIYENN